MLSVVHVTIDELDDYDVSINSIFNKVNNFIERFNLEQLILPRKTTYMIPRSIITLRTGSD